MIIVNKTPYALNVSGKRLDAGKKGRVTEFVSCTTEISGPVGSCTITTKNNQRTIKNSGKLVAEEGKEEDDRNMKYIHVTLKK